jgi:hypothetical protein
LTRKYSRGDPHCKRILLIFKNRKKTVQIKEGLKELSHTTSKRAGETALQRSRRN